MVTVKMSGNSHSRDSVEGERHLEEKNKKNKKEDKYKKATKKIGENGKKSDNPAGRDWQHLRGKK